MCGDSECPTKKPLKLVSRLSQYVFTYEAVSTYISANELTTEEEDDISEMDNSMD